jgi:hypothetical protein
MKSSVRYATCIRHACEKALTSRCRRQVTEFSQKLGVDSGKNKRSGGATEPQATDVVSGLRIA